MKVFRSTGLGLLGMLACLLPAAAQGARGRVTAPGVFSFQAPAGWNVETTSMSKYPVAVDAPANGFAANVNVVDQSFPGTLASYVDANCEQLRTTPLFKNVKILSRQPFTTNGGLQGTCVTVDDTLGKADMQQAFYFFSGPGDTKFVATCSSLLADGTRYAPVFAASMKTFTVP